MIAPASDKWTIDCQGYTLDMVSVLKGPGFLTGPMRYLAHGRIVHLYWEFLAWFEVNFANSGQSARRPQTANVSTLG